MNALRVAVVDDESAVRRGLKTLLQREPGICLVGEAADGAAAVAMIRAESPDVVFLDVQMPELDGFAVLLQLAEQRPAIVFVTAHDAHAVRAFDHHAVDYLLKPFDADRFRIALGRARDRVQRGVPSSDVRPTSALYLERMIIRHGGNSVVVNVGEIDWLQAADNYVRVHTASTRYLMRAQLGVLERRLDPRHFLRIHRSTIVRVSRIVALRPRFGGDADLRLSCSVTLRCSRGYRGALDASMGRLR